MRQRSYSDLRGLTTLEERFNYLSIGGEIGYATFGFDRYLNQKFYTSYEWRSARRDVIARDGGCDLGIPDYPIRHNILVHHMNPITPDQIIDRDDDIINPDFLITTSQLTHNAIHYGDERLLPRLHVDRQRGDTKLW